jgi:hypothetical protein
VIRSVAFIAGRWTIGCVFTVAEHKSDCQNKNEFFHKIRFFIVVRLVSLRHLAALPTIRLLENSGRKDGGWRNDGMFPEAQILCREGQLNIFWPRTLKLNALNQKVTQVLQESVLIPKVDLVIKRSKYTSIPATTLRCRRGAYHLNRTTCENR